VTVGGEHGVSASVVGAEQLVSTIEEVETHENDPTAERADDPWNTFHDEFGGLGKRLKDTYRKVSSADGPSEEEIKDAFGTLMDAWDQVAESVTTALRDPEVRERLRAAASSFASAVGNTISELGNELRDDESAPWSRDGRGTAGEESRPGSED
jgi:hypothetical protein